MKTLAQLIGVLLCLALGIGAGQLYQNYRAAEAQQAQEKDVDLSIIGMQAETRPIMVSLSTCPACRSAREWLAEHKVDYLELAIDQSDEADRIARQLDIKSVPAFLIGGRQVTGFAPERWSELLGARLTAASK
jgi:glutaredoxin